MKKVKCGECYAKSKETVYHYHWACSCVVSDSGCVHRGSE